MVEVQDHALAMCKNQLIANCMHGLLTSSWLLYLEYPMQGSIGPSVIPYLYLCERDNAKCMP